MKNRYLTALIPILLVPQALHAERPQTPPGLQQPPPGRLEAKIATLPPAARARALEWLQRFNFPIEDLDTLDVDGDGGVLYVDPNPELSAGIVGASEPQAAGLSQTEVFSLHSRPGAANVVFVDVDGHTITSTVWNANGAASYTARPYNRDGNYAAFSQSELDDIANIWHRIAEDFAPFDIDVTTEEPANFGAQVGRILITNNVDANGVEMPYATGGGVAYVGVWGRTNFAYNQPALVYYNNLGGGQPRYVAEASSHELGHNLGLSHDGITGGATYYGGHGNGLVNWAPIMGNSYGSQVSQWSRGEYNGANNTQDDTAIIEAKLGLSDDDHSDAFANATPLFVEADGSIVGTDPEVDPFNIEPANKGVIEVLGDVDVFSFSTAGGLIDLTLTPAWIAYRNDNSRGANLDILASLYDSGGVLIASSDPAVDTVANLQLTVPGGVYYLELASVGAGDPVDSYDDYASQGQYFINGSVIADAVNTAPVAANDNAAVDEDGQINVDVMANDNDADGDTLSIVSISQPSRGSASTDGFSIAYTPAANVSGNDSLTYTISDGRGGSASGILSVAVNAINDAPNPANDNYTVDAGVSTTLSVLDNDNDIDSTTLTIVATTGASHGRVTILNGASVVYAADTGYAGPDTFEYTVVDDLGASARGSVNLTVRDTAAPPSTPTGVAASDNSNGSATITWQSVAGQVQSYDIQRETRHKKRNSWNGTAIVGSAANDETSFTNNTSVNTYRYRVRALNQGGASAWSGWVTVTVTDSSGGGGKGKGRPKR